MCSSNLVNMSQLIITIIICILSLKISAAQNFEESIINVNHFLNNLRKKYEATELTDNIKSLIDQEIDQYLEIALKQFPISRFKKELSNPKTRKTGVDVFENLEQFLKINISYARDVHFFKRYSGYEQWFVAVLAPHNVTVLRFLDNALVESASYSVQNVVKLHVIKFYGNILLIAQKLESIAILYFFPQDRKFSIREVQNLSIPRIKHLSVWREKEQLFLAVSTSSAIHMYTRQESSFQLLRSLPFGSDFSAPMQLEDSATLLFTSSQRKCSILEYLPQSRQFVTAQTIRRPLISDIAILQLKKDEPSMVREYLLAASSNERTIVYKREEAEDVFRPFQELAPAERVLSITKNNAAVLLLLKDDILDVYQYDGWRFVRLNYQLVGAQTAKLVADGSEELLLLKRLDDSWSLNRIKWMNVDESMNSNKEILEWCSAAKETAKHVPKPIPEMKTPIKISNSHIRKLNVKSVNGMSIQKLQNLTERYNQLITRVKAINETLNEATPVENPQFDSLRAQTVRVKCAKKCSVKNLETKMKCDVFSKLQKINDEAQVLRFEHVKVNKLDGFPCPVAGISLKEINVKGLVNGISFDDLRNNVLRTSGDQVVTGDHVFAELHVDSLIAPNIDVASTKTRQRIRTDVVRAKELSYADGGLLPLDGEPVTMTGTLVASRVMFNGLVDLHCGINAQAFEKYEPMASFLNPYELHGNYTLSNVEVVKLLVADDIARNYGKSVKEIAEKAIPLGGNVPVRLNFMRNSTVWSNVTAENMPKFLSRKNPQKVKVTGKKMTLKYVTLPESIYSKLPIPNLQAFICVLNAKALNVKTSTLRVGEATANVVVSDHIYGAQELDNILMDSVTSLDEVDLSHKTFTGTVYVENVNISDFKNSPFYSFENSKFKWYNPYLIEGPILVKNLKVDSLHASQGIKIPPPAKIGNMIVEGNLKVKTINGILLDEFVKNIVRTNDTMLANQITFVGSLEIDEIETTNSNIDLQSLENNLYLGNKIITGDLEIENDLSIPNLLSYPPADEVSSYVIHGSVTFKKEPDIESLNGKKLHELISKIWMMNRPSNLKGKFVMKNVTLSKPFDSYNSLDTPNFGSWKSLESRLLSKTKLQEIPFPAHFTMAKIPNIITRGNSVLHSSDKYLNDLLYMTLKKNQNQIIEDVWRFDQLTIDGNLTLLGKINNLNLSSDVARFDVELNKVTGKKVVDELTARNLGGLNFGEWAKDALIQTDSEQPIIITGRKTFNSLNARILNVSGTVMGKKLEDCLLKNGDQVIKAPKLLKGSLHAPSITVEGLINDVHLTDFVNHQLKRRKSLQKIKSKVAFKGNLQIMGNLTVGEDFQGIQLSKLNMINESFSLALNAAAYLTPFAKEIEAVFNNRAKYWDNFEDVEGNIALSHDRETLLKNNFRFPVLGNCTFKSWSQIICNDLNTFHLRSLTNETEIIVNQMLSVQDIPVVVQISCGQRSRITIYKYDYITNFFDLAASLRSPGIIEASVSSVDGVVWVAARLASHMLIARYQPRFGLQKYHLPDSRAFALAPIPTTGELVLVREDGVWKLDGLAEPQLALEADLRAKRFETFSAERDFYVRLNREDNSTRLLRATYVGV